MSQSDPRGQLTTASPSPLGQPQDDPTKQSLSADEIFHLLQTNRRRNALRYLKTHESPVRMRDLAEQVAAWENDTTVQALTSTQRQRVYIPLYQTHLPKLDEAGVIQYDQSRGIVERLPLADELDVYLPEGETDADGATTDDRSTTDATEATTGRDWIGYYTNASGLSVALIGGTVLGLPVFSRLSGIVVGVVVSVMFGLLTLARYVDRSLDPVE